MDPKLQNQVAVNTRTSLDRSNFCMTQCLAPLWCLHWLLIFIINEAFAMRRVSLQEVVYFHCVRFQTACLTLWCLTLWCLTLCDPVDCSPPGSSVHGMLQAGILEWVAMPSSRGSSRPRDLFPASLTSPALAGRFFTASTWEALLLGWIVETKWVIHKPSSFIILPSLLTSLYYYLLVIFFSFHSTHFW